MRQDGGHRYGDRLVDDPVSPVSPVSPSTSALALGVLGLLAGLTFALYIPAISLGAAALALDLVAHRQSTRLAVGRRRTGAWLGAAAISLGVIGLADARMFEDQGRHHDRFVASAPLPAAGDLWAIGDTATTGPIVVTLDGVTDPYTSDELIDPHPGHRLVALAVEFENLDTVPRTFGISQHVKLVDDRDRPLDIADVGLVLPDPDADLAPSEPRHSLIVFEVPADATNLELYIQGDDTDPGIWFDLDHEI